jgi:hypothetical protein
MLFRFRIADLMVLVALAAGGAFTYRFDPDLFAVLVWALFLSAVCTSTVIAWLGRGGLCRFAVGSALFGWTWLACGLGCSRRTRSSFSTVF